MITHSPDPTVPLSNWSSVARAYFQGTSLCRRKPVKHAMAVHPKVANVDCKACLRRLGFDEFGRPLGEQP